MEIKLPAAIPLWLEHRAAYPTRFSKCGMAYAAFTRRAEAGKGGDICA